MSAALPPSTPYAPRSRRTSLRPVDAAGSLAAEQQQQQQSLANTTTPLTRTTTAAPFASQRRGSVRAGGDVSGGGVDTTLPVPSTRLSLARRSLAVTRRRFSHALSSTTGSACGGAAAAAASTHATSVKSAAAATPAAAAAATANVFTVHVDGDDGGVELRMACRQLYAAVCMRNKYSRAAGRAVSLHVDDKDTSDDVDGSNNNNNNSSGGGDTQRGLRQPVSLHIGDGIYYVVEAGGGEATTMTSLRATTTTAGRGSNPTAAAARDSAAAAETSNSNSVYACVVPWEAYYDDVCALTTCVQHAMCRAAAEGRLQLLEEKHHLYELCNGEDGEQPQSEQLVRRGSSNNSNSNSGGGGGGGAVAECGVDNYVELQTMMDATWLTSYIQRTIRTRGGDVVSTSTTSGVDDGSASVATAAASRNRSSTATTTTTTANATAATASHEPPLTLQRLCELIDVDASRPLTPDTFGLHPRIERPLARFDVLAASTSQGVPHSTRLLRLFLSLDGPKRGRYLADAVRRTLQCNEDAGDGGGGGGNNMIASSHDKDDDDDGSSSACGGGGNDSIDEVSYMDDHDDVDGDDSDHDDDDDDDVDDGSSDDGGVDGDVADDDVFSASGGGGGSGAPRRSRHHRSRCHHHHRHSRRRARAAATPRRVHEVGLELTGHRADEWEATAAWLHEHHLDTCASVQWLATLSWRRVRATTATTTTATATTSAAGGGSASRSNSTSPALQTPTAAAAAASMSSIGAATPSPSTTLDNYQQLFDHLFRPLFLATLSPDDARYAPLARLLRRVGGFVFVPDDDAEVERACARTRRRPADVPWAEAMSNHYVLYYLYANICTLNALRRRRGWSALQLRVLSGTRRAPGRGDDVLLSAYLLSDAVISALALTTLPVLQYLYGIHRVGVLACPVCNNGLAAVPYAQHPLPTLLRRGVCVSLCTVHPLLFHHSSDALSEEYAMAQRLFRLSRVDVRELAYNAVVLSTCSAVRKARALGCADVARVRAAATTTRDAATATMAALVEQQALLPLARVQLRRDMWAAELSVLQHSVHAAAATTTTAMAMTAVSSPTRDATTTTTTLESHGATTAAAPRRRSSGGNSSSSGGGSVASGGAAVAADERGAHAAAATTPHTTGVWLSRELPSRAPYVVLDTRVHYPRVLLVGPYDRDMQYASVAQSLRRALELRSQYVQPFHRTRYVDVDAIAAAAACSGSGNSNDSSKAGDATSSSVYDATRSTTAAATASSPAASPYNNNNNNSSTRSDGSRTTPAFDENEWMYKTVEGVIVPHEVHQIPRLPQGMHHYDDFRQHVQEVRELLSRLPVRSFASRRLRLLEHRFRLHIALNRGLEAGTTAEKASQNRDVYQATKVDNNVRMETGMTARQLLEFIVRKAHGNGDDIVAQQPGREPQTLRQLLQELHIRADALTVDDLNVYVDGTRDDNDDDNDDNNNDDNNNDNDDDDDDSHAVTLPYTPVAHNPLLTLLLTTNNAMNGRYFAELTQMTFANYKRDRFTFTESRLPIYGARADEWERLSTWFDTHGMASPHNQWMVQFPRRYRVLRRRGVVASFAHYLENLFAPLWAVSLHPNAQPRLFHFVNQVSGFDCVGDEGRDDAPLHTTTTTSTTTSSTTSPLCAPHEWVSDAEPPYNYYLYHIWANVYSLNAFRRRRGFSTFAFRPSCGEAGHVDHLIGGFLLAHDINYGLQLRNEVVLQYLYYLAQIGITMSPLSNNAKRLDYLASPFPTFFRRGLVVTLGTESPLLYHQTQEPLLEEYSIASKIWRLQPNDLCEVARNSVLVSSFTRGFKQERLGALYFLSSSVANDASRTHLSSVRVAYRFETYHSEMGFLEYVAGQTFPKAMYTLAEEQQRLGEWRERLQWHASALAAQRRRRLRPAQMGKSGGGGGGVAAATSAAAAARDDANNDDDDDDDGHLIDATANEADLSKLSAQRNVMLQQLDTLSRTLQELQQQNKQLTDKLSEERERDMQAAQLRRTRAERAEGDDHNEDADGGTRSPARRTRSAKLRSMLSLALPPPRTSTAGLLTRLTTTDRHGDGTAAAAAAARGSVDDAAAYDMDSNRASVSLNVVSSLLQPSSSSSSSQQQPQSTMMTRTMTAATAVGRAAQRCASDVHWQLPTLAPRGTVTAETTTTTTAAAGVLDGGDAQSSRLQQQQQHKGEAVAMARDGGSGGGDDALLGFAETLWCHKPPTQRDVP